MATWGQGFNSQHTQHKQPEALWLADEFRPTMPREVMQLWGKDAVKEVRSGFECGLVFDGYDKMQELDIVEAYIMVEVPR